LLGSLPSDVQFSGGDKAEYDASEDHYGVCVEFSHTLL